MTFSSSTTKITISLVGFIPADSLTLSAMLTASDYHVVSISDFQWPDEYHPDLLILDLGVETIEFYQQLITDEYRKHIPVIFAIPSGDGAAREKIFALGGADYIARPFLKAEILHRVQMYDIQRDMIDCRRTGKKIQLNEARLEALLELKRMSDTASIKEIADFALEQAVALTGSIIGFLLFLNPDESEATMHAWSKHAMGSCAIEQPPIKFNIAESGIWGEAVRQRQPTVINDFSRPHPLKRGYPEGHVPITRYLGIPVFEGEHIVTIIAAGNKQTDYDESDIRQLNLLADSMWRVIQHKRIQDELQQSEANLRAIFNSTGLSFVLIDNSYHIIDANQSFKQAAKDILGKQMKPGDSIYDFVLDRDRDGFDINFKKAMQGDSVLVEKEFHGQGGKPYYLEMLYYPVIDEQQNIMGVCMSTRDVTYRKEAEQKALELPAERERMRALRQFLTSASHDLRTPLAAMGTSLYLLRKLNLSPEQAERTAVLEAQVSRLNQILEDMFAMSELDMTDRLEFSEINMRNLLSQIVDEYTDIAIKKKQSLELIANPDPDIEEIQISADKIQLRRALEALIYNAITYTPENGHIEVHPYRENNHIVVEIKDTGIGIHPEDVPHIFERFYRADKARGTHNGGSGLGLPIARRIAELHHGQLELHSQPGKGSTFSLKLPGYLPES